MLAAALVRIRWFPRTGVGVIAVAETAKGFWHTAPGMITAVAALVTAIGGLLGILIQNDVIGWDRDDRQLSAPQDSAGTPGGDDAGRPAAEATASPPTGTPDIVPWERATADLVRQDGTSTTVKATTVGLACDTGSLALENGQRIRLEIVRSIRFDAVHTDSASADGVVTLLDGRGLTEPLHTWNCPVLAQNELGRVEIALEDIHRIEFHR